MVDFTLLVSDLRSATIVLFGRVEFYTGDVYLHFTSNDQYQIAQNILKEFAQSDLSPENYVKWKNKENCHLSLDAFLLKIRGEIVAKRFGF